MSRELLVTRVIPRHAMPCHAMPRHNTLMMNNITRPQEMCNVLIAYAADPRHKDVMGPPGPIS